MRIDLWESSANERLRSEDVCVANDDNRLVRGTLAVRQKEMKFEVLNRDGYSNISGRSCPPNSMIVSAGIFKRLAASRIASALGASYRQ